MTPRDYMRKLTALSWDIPRDKPKLFSEYDRLNEILEDVIEYGEESRFKYFKKEFEKFKEALK